MSKYISIFFLTIFVSVLLFNLLMSLFGGDFIETSIIAFGTIVIVLQSFIIAVLYYMLDRLKKK